MTRIVNMLCIASFILLSLCYVDLAGRVMELEHDPVKTWANKKIRDMYPCEHGK